MRAVGAELDRRADFEGQVGDGGAGGRIPEPDPVDVGRGQQATVGAEVDGVWAPVVRPRRPVADHAVVQRAALPAVGELPDPEPAILPQHHLPVIGADPDQSGVAR